MLKAIGDFAEMHLRKGHESLKHINKHDFTFEELFDSKMTYDFIIKLKFASLSLVYVVFILFR